MTNTSTYETATINGHQIEVHYTFHGVELYVSKDGVQLYGHKVSGNPMEKAAEIVARLSGAEVKPVAEKLEKANQALAQALKSDHVKSVMVGFEYEADGVRYYTAITRHAQALHKYTVRVWDEFEGGELQHIGKCNCYAGSKGLICRHVTRVAEVDALRMQREVYPVQLAQYKAYKHYQKAA